MSRTHVVVAAAALALAAATPALAAHSPRADSTAVSPPGAGSPHGGEHFAPAAQVRAVLAQIDPARIAQYDRTLASFRSRNTLSAQNNPHFGVGAARDYIFGQFRDFAAHSGGRLSVQLQSYVQGTVPGAIPHPVKITNVVATLRGVQPASEHRVYVVSGHYDSRGNDVENPNCVCPGADDDASGVSVSLELARVMSRYAWDATIKFVAVDGEEQGLFGSTHFVQVAKRQHLDIEGMLDNDIVGTANGDDPHTVRLFAEGVPSDETPAEAAIRQAVGGENDSPARQLARFIKSESENDATDMSVWLIWRRDRYLRGGDQIPFLENGYRSAVRFTETRENFNHQHQDVRTVHGVQFGDLVKFVDFDYLARVARVNAAALGALALAPTAPKGSQIIATRLTNTTTITWKPNTEPDLAGYEVVWRLTTSPLWEHVLRLGKTTRATLNLSKDDYFFGVRAVDTAGNRSPVSFPTPKF